LVLLTPAANSIMPVISISRISALKILFVSLLGSLLLFSACGRKPGNANGESSTDPGQLARQYMANNKFDEAEASFIKAIQVTPDNILNYGSLARLYLLQNNYSAAENEVKAGLKIKQDNPDLKLLLAEVYIEKGDKKSAVNELKDIIVKYPKNGKAWYKLAGLGEPGASKNWEKNCLLKSLSLIPANIVLRLKLAEIYAGANQADSARFFMEGVKKIAPDFSAVAEVTYQKAVSFLQGNNAVSALPYIQQFHKLMKTSAAYASGTDEIDVPQLLDGYPAFNTSLTSDGSSSLSGFIFTDATAQVGLANGNTQKGTHAVIAVADYDQEGNMYVYSSVQPAGSSSSKRSLFTTKEGDFKLSTGIDAMDDPGQDLYATFADYDNDGYQDLFIATTKGMIVYHNNGDGTFNKIKEDIGLHNITGVRKLLFADFDQDGDLDLYVAEKGGNKFFRNNGDGTFTETAGNMGLTGDPRGTLGMDFGDWDSDGDLDIAALREDGSLSLLTNNRHSKFQDISDSLGLRKYKGKAVAFGDYNNDGLLDMVVAGGTGGQCTLLQNTGHGFTVDPASKTLSNSLKGITVTDVAFLDFDNDGHQDLLVTGVNADPSKSGVRLFHNDTIKGFSDVSYLLPKTVTQAQHAEIVDFNADGDEDIFLAGPAGVQLVRNDGGNRNNFMQVRLAGLAYGNSKNNRLGIGAQVELKAGDLYQRKTVTGPVTEFGVGGRKQLDAVRIVWPNGVPQTIVDPSSNERILEQEQLKGSCPFLFTWNGKKYEFIKDMLWRSALGMPLAIHGRDTTYSFSDASREYLLIPGDKLKPKDGKYSIKITEELWEAVYFDKAALVAVDHPDSIDTYVDERFVLPPFPGKTVYKVAKKYLPVSAKDEKGNDLLPKISKYDFQYAASFSLTKFQGLAEDHSLILDLGDKAKSDSLHLFLRGWIFPTDASINTAMAQSAKYRVHPPCLQVINSKGEWQTVIPNMGFPMGRDKMVIADLSGKFLTPNDRRVRINTNMQIYWDQLFFSAGSVKSPVKMTDMVMTGATLGYRGYSSSYRKGGPYGPEWFDYYHTTTGQKWRDLTGNYTRYGDVLPLLQQGDDKYIIADGGDEISIDFDAQRLPAIPKGWKRDFLIYSEGWVKDGDLNTANGQTVIPLPFHKMTSYPYHNGGYPNDAEHRAYQLKYNTRKVNTTDFRNALRNMGSSIPAKGAP
jgi:tetratricopeptide (TPR) repeat protein